eukprot:COSAG06_NODE_3811_length_4884_cov_11.896134_6_plen_147_part_00
MQDPGAESKEGGEGIEFNALHDPDANAQICAGIKAGIDMQVRKRIFLRHFMLKTIILPRQARDKHRESAQKIVMQVKDPELAALLTPDYPFFCKRALFIDDYYTTFNKPNVRLVHDDGGVVGVDSSGLTVGCGARNADAFPINQSK